MEEFDVSLLSFRGMPMMYVRKNQVVFNARAVGLIGGDYIRVFYDAGNLIIKPAETGIPFQKNKKGNCAIMALPFLQWLKEKGFTTGKYLLTKNEDGYYKATA